MFYFAAGVGYGWCAGLGGVEWRLAAVGYDS
jgi:hypothetical protein